MMVQKRGSVVMPHVSVTQSYSGALNDLGTSLTEILMPDGRQEIQETALFHVNFERYLRKIFSIIQWQAEILITDHKLYSKAPKFRQILPQSAKVT